MNVEVDGICSRVARWTDATPLPCRLGDWFWDEKYPTASGEDNDSAVVDRLADVVGLGSGVDISEGRAAGEQPDGLATGQMSWRWRAVCKLDWINCG